MKERVEKFISERAAEHELYPVGRLRTAEKWAREVEIQAIEIIKELWAGRRIDYKEHYEALRLQRIQDNKFKDRFLKEITEENQALKKREKKLEMALFRISLAKASGGGSYLSDTGILERAILIAKEALSGGSDA